MADSFRPNPLRLAFGLMRLPKLPDGSIEGGLSDELIKTCIDFMSDLDFIPENN